MLSALENHAIDEGLDRQNLAILRRRFEKINQNRLERLTNALSDRQQLFIRALPILFHTNHPMMPGYVSRHTPARIANYKPDKTDLRIGKQVARSFIFNYDSRESQIDAIYVMGSVGTIAQSGRSDLDIWLCYKPGLRAEHINELKKKCAGISQWGASLRLEVHFFPMDAGKFSRGTTTSLGKESSGNAQRLLLLDEFYRTAILLCGRMPLWWFVPDHQEHNYSEYTHTLLQKRFLREEDILDFGGIPTIPEGEFLGAGIWQLYKAIESPYKSVLKILLLEAYASEYPNINPLSLRYKKLVYSGVSNINNLDGYVLIFERIAEYLKSQKQDKRLELARRCFYFKVNKALSKPAHNSHKSWQRSQLEDMTKSWGWNQKYFTVLDEREHWKAHQVAQERGMLVNELNHGYQCLLEFASNIKTGQSITGEELTVLGRKLQAAFERRPGKIEWINPGISKDLSESVLVLTEQTDKNNNTIWTVITHTPNTFRNSANEAIKASSNLVELLLWCYYNGIANSHTYFDLQYSNSISEYELRKLFTIFQQSIPLPEQSIEHRFFEKTAIPTKALMLLNVGGKTSSANNSDIQLLSNKTDALRYGGFEENLVVSIDMVSCNSWDEISTRRFDKKTALQEALLEYLQLCLPGTHQKPPRLIIECIGAAHAPTINQRVRNLFREIAECYYSGRYSPTTRYIFEMAGKLFCLQFKGLRPSIKQFDNQELLLEHLGTEQTSPSPIVLDSCAVTKHPLRAIAAVMTPQSIDIFYRRFDIGMEIYITDEKGSLNYFMLRGQRNFVPIAPLHRFLRAVLNREARINQHQNPDFGIHPINFYELRKRQNQGYECLVRHFSTELPEAGLSFDVKAVGHTDSEGQLLFDFYCDDQEFNALSFGDQLYLVVAQFILSHRRTKENYPVYITDLDLSLCQERIAENGQLQTSHYLQVKNALEFQLNQAIGILLKA